MREHHLTVRRTARYCTLGGEGDIRTVWYVLHGYRQLADHFIRRFDSLASPERLIVAPEALNRFYLDDDGLKRHGPESPVGATWMTRHERETEIDDYVTYLDRLDRSLGLGRDIRRIVLGFSQGAATVARWAILGRRHPDRLVLWAGTLPHDLAPAAHARRLRALAPVFVLGDNDPAMPAGAVDAERARLEAMGVEGTVLRHPGGHTIDRETLKRLASRIDPQPDA